MNVFVIYHRKKLTTLSKWRKQKLRQEPGERPACQLLCYAFRMMKEYDVLVAGGGPSGFIAAVAAARNGARTALIEKNGFLGGLATSGLVSPISEFRKNGRLIVKGIPWEFIKRLEAAGGAVTDYPNGNIPFDSELYKLTAARMVAEEGIDCYLSSTLTGCEVKDNQIGSVQISGLSGTYSLSASRYIDCTGDAMLSLHAGLEMQEENETQPASLCFRIGNVDLAKLDNAELREEGTKYANREIRSTLESLRAEGVDVPLFGGPWFQRDVRPGAVYANITRSAVCPDDPLETSKVEAKLREDAYCLFRLLKEHVPAFRESQLIETAAHIGYRQSRRIKGKHILTGSEILSGLPFEDTVAFTAHPVDIHLPGSTGQSVRFLDRPGAIPYRSLYSEAIGNLLVAGRCISADKEAIASARVQAPSMAMGQAAGTAAALSFKEGRGVEDLDTERLRDTLLSQKAVV